jgi:hypothetical protein
MKLRALLTIVACLSFVSAVLADENSDKLTELRTLWHR